MYSADTCGQTVELCEQWYAVFVAVSVFDSVKQGNTHKTWSHYSLPVVADVSNGFCVANGKATHENRATWQDMYAGINTSRYKMYCGFWPTSAKGYLHC